MPASLSKLHVRFIQTQKRFQLHNEANGDDANLSLQQLYIKNSGSFYFANLAAEIEDASPLRLTFNEANDYLKRLRCRCHATLIEAGSDEYEEALLFFHQDASQIRQLLLLRLDTVEEN